MCPALSPVVTGFGPFNPATDPPLAAPNTRLDNRIEVPVNGLVAQIRNNGATYGWNTALSMYRRESPVRGVLPEPVGHQPDRLHHRHDRTRKALVPDSTRTTWASSSTPTCCRRPC